MGENKNIILTSEEYLFLLERLEELNIIKQNNELKKDKIKKDYKCEDSELLDFNPRYEHIEKSEYKGKTCYIVVKNN